MNPITDTMVTIALLLLAAAALGGMALVATRRRPAPATYIEQAVADLPEGYRGTALREIDVTRRVLRTVSRKEVDRIVDLVRQMAREHGETVAAN